MNILRTYARVWVDDLPAAIAAYEQVLGRKADHRLDFKGSQLVGVGEVLLISGPAEVTDGFRGTAGPFLVEDISQAVAEVEAVGGKLTSEVFEASTGRLFYADMPGGGNLEFLQWNDELVERIIGRNPAN